MEIVRVTRRLGAILALVALTAVASAHSGDARIAAVQPPGKCPADPGKVLSINFAVGYYRGAKLAGMTFCHDGASARATVNGKIYSFTNGVCFRQGDEFDVKIGTPMELKLKIGDPPGFTATDVPPSKYFSGGVWFGLARAGKVVEWGFGKVKMKVTRGSAPKGTFSGAAPTLVQGKLTNVSV